MHPNRVPVADSAPYHDALEQCVDHWALIPEHTQSVRDGVSHVFASDTVDGERVIIRITDGTIRERGELLGELAWLEHLIQHGCTVTNPRLSRNGDLLETVDLETGTYHVCCFERFGGEQIDAATDSRWNDELFHKLGREIGRIHRVSDSFRLPPEHDRRQWYQSELSQIPDPLPRGFNPAVTKRMQEFTDEMRGRSIKPQHYGLVHRDLHAGNFLIERGDVQIIDFDLGCYGWRAMDFLVMVFGHYYYPSNRVPNASPELAGHVLATMVRGYREEHTIDDEQFAFVDDLFKLRQIIIYVASAGNVEHWQIAMGNPTPTVAESVAWIENLWLKNVGLRVDLSQL